MNKKTILRSLIAGTFICFTGWATGQPSGGFGRSPQINPDKTVTFRINAPNAQDVKLSVQSEKAPVQMVKDARGSWSVTVGPVKPDIYPYNFVIDGVQVMDAGNMYYFPNERFKGSLLDVSGDSSLIHSMRDVPHGTVTYEFYPSAEGTTGTVLVYTPPGYDNNPGQKYPVFYLIGGTTDTEETWFKVGKANLILDNLIAEGKARPMIIVMPYGNIEARIAEQKGGLKPADPAGRESAEAIARSKTFERDLVDNLIPYIEKNYRVIANSENRAIGGFSRGGGQTLRTGFGNMDKFAWICCYSAYLTSTELERDFTTVVENPEETNRKLKLLWVSVGNEDRLYKPATEFIDYLKAKNINHKTLISSGGHTWMNTKLYLANTAPLLFK
ncbi:MAG: alpha/beta hydrolase-fold protein [Bacteroidales bacterium]|jgi:enterochelin esterase family protein|nr:alpha/beta hydrolase-fold protein [Bacteroidales bacterium]